MALFNLKKKKTHKAKSISDFAQYVRDNHCREVVVVRFCAVAKMDERVFVTVGIDGQFIYGAAFIAAGHHEVIHCTCQYRRRDGSEFGPGDASQRVESEAYSLKKLKRDMVHLNFMAPEVKITLYDSHEPNLSDENVLTSPPTLHLKELRKWVEGLSPKMISEGDELGVSVNRNFLQTFGWPLRTRD